MFTNNCFRQHNSTEYNTILYNTHHMRFISKIICKLDLDVEKNRYELDWVKDENGQLLCWQIGDRKLSYDLGPTHVPCDPNLETLWDCALDYFLL